MAKYAELKSIAAALGTTLVMSLTLASTADAGADPFGIRPVSAPRQGLSEPRVPLAADTASGESKGAEGKCGGEKGAEGKCGN